MAKDKHSSKAAAVSSKTNVSSKPLGSVKDGRVNKVAEKAKNVSKETAKKTAKAIEKKSKKTREPTPESESESDSEDENTSVSSASSDEESEEEETRPLPKVNGTAKKAAKAQESEDDDDSEDDSDVSSDGSEESDSDEEPAPKKTQAAKVNGLMNGTAAAHADDDSSEDSSEEDDDDSEDDDEDEEEAPKVNGTKKVESDNDDDDDEESDSDDESGSDESSDDDEEEEVPKAVDNKKRKAEIEPEQTPKKAKTGDSTGIANLFVGNLSWNVDEEWLTREFENYGELKGVRIITNYDTGRSKGFGYVEFVNAEDAATAQAEKHESDLDGRPLNVDFSAPRGAKNDAHTPQQKSFDRAKKFGDQMNEPSATLFVGNISFNADESMVTETFQEYGSIKAVRLPTDRESGQPKGFGYVEMSSVDEAKAALESLQGADLAGRPIRLDYAGARPNDSPGGRGGFGGGRGRGGFGDRGGRGGRGGFGDRGGRGGRGGGRGGSTNRGGFGDFSGRKTTF